MSYKGRTVSYNGKQGLLLSYNQNTDKYYVAWDGGRYSHIGRSYVRNVDLTPDPELADLLLQNSHLGKLIQDSNGWDIVSGMADGYDDDRIEGGEEYNEDINMPVGHSDRKEFKWDSATKSLVEVSGSDNLDADYRSWTPFHQDPAVQTQHPHSPETDGFFARDPKHNEQNRDFAFSHHKGSTMTEFSNIYEEEQYRFATAATLNDCPECGDKMMDGDDASHCYSCGHKQPVHYAAVKESNPLALLGLMGGEGAAAAGGAGIAGGLGGAAGLARWAPMIGNLMTNAAGGSKGGGEAPVEEPTVGGQEELDRVASFDESDDIGSASENRGEDDDNIDDSGNEGANEDRGDSPELLKDVNDIGGSQGTHALDRFFDAIPQILPFLNTDKSAKDEDWFRDLDKSLGDLEGYERVTIDEDGDGTPDKIETREISGEDKDDDLSKAASWTIFTYGGPQQVNVGAPTPLNAQPGQMSQPAQPAAGPDGTCARCGNPTAGLLQCPASDPACPQRLPAAADNASMQGDPMQAMASTEHTAVRIPKMCPFHTQLVEFIRGTGDAQFAAAMMGPSLMSQHSCKGGWTGEDGNGKCKFKPEMATVKYWNEKEADAEAKKQERELRKQQEQQMLQEQQEEQQAQVFNIHQDIPETEALPEANDWNPAPSYAPASGGGWSPGSDGQASAITAQPAMPVAAKRKRAADIDRSPADKGDIDGADFYEESSGTLNGQRDVDSAGGDIVDGDGDPLEKGETYRIYNPDVDSEIPDVVKILEVTPHYVKVQVVGDQYGFDFTDRIPVEEIKAEGLEFSKHTEHPNANGVTDDSLENNDDSRDKGQLPGVTDLDTGKNSLSSATSRNWLMPKEAGKNFSQGEQRELISESGVARNLHKLDLSQTHYENVDYSSLSNETDLDDSFLW